MTRADVWHAMSSAEVLERLGVTPGGLDDAEAARRLESVGPNELKAEPRASAWRLLGDQLKNVLVVVLLIATGLSIALGHGLESLVIAVIVLFSVGLGFLQEFRAERALESLRRMAAPLATVIRGGREQRVAAREVVPGDILKLTPGDRVAADGRLVEAVNLRADESALTGESVAVEKDARAEVSQDAAVGDRFTMVHAGTAIAYGRALAVVVQTGTSTEFGKIAQLLQTVEQGRTPLQKNLDRVGATLAKVALVVVAVIVGSGLFRGQPLIDMFLFGVALAVAVVPEALPAVVTISLALGVQRMVKRNALIRRLSAVETLGSTSVICSDKTGTLTKDEMTARRLYAGAALYELSGVGYEPVGELTRDGAPCGAAPSVRRLLEAAVLASDARLSRSPKAQEPRVTGDPTEGAVVVAAAKLGIDREALDAAHERLFEIPFSADTRRMTTVVRVPGGGRRACVKGAPEAVLPLCRAIASDDGDLALDPAALTRVDGAAQALASQGLRVLAVASKELTEPPEASEASEASEPSAEEGLTLLGLVGLMDPPRPEVFDAIARCKQAGIRAVMITGDHPATARAIAAELEFTSGGRVVTGVELDGWGDAERFVREVADVEVFARVSPAHKLRVVEALQARGEIVAMTGDGVNDAPALRKADIGIAMGRSGTDVSREAAAITLTDDSFASIVAAVEEGRQVFGNIKKYLMYLLSSNLGEIGLMAGAALLGLPLPLSAVQVLYVNLATDGLPALALAVDPPEPGLMARKPRDARRGIFTRPVVVLMVVGGLWSAVVNVALFSWALASGRPEAEAMAMTFVSLVLIQFVKAYNYRSDRVSALRNTFANRWLNVAILWELLLLVALLYVPFLQRLFGTHGLTALEWLLIGGLSLTIAPVLELSKWLERRGVFGPLD